MSRFLICTGDSCQFFGISRHEFCFVFFSGWQTQDEKLINEPAPNGQDSSCGQVHRSLLVAITTIMELSPNQIRYIQFARKKKYSLYYVHVVYHKIILPSEFQQHATRMCHDVHQLTIWKCQFKKSQLKIMFVNLL